MKNIRPDLTINQNTGSGGKPVSIKMDSTQCKAFYILLLPLVDV
jgi:hypothetical protein